VTDIATYSDDCNCPFQRFAAEADDQFEDDEPVAPYVKTALAYAEERGWKVFPARMEDGKKYSWLSRELAPERQNWGMSKDPQQLKRNFTEPKWQHECGIGIPTGEVNGIFVVEADTVKGHGTDGLKSLAALEAKHGKLPPTLMAESPTGSIHRYFKHPGIKVVSHTIEDGVDCKGDGGMVIAPPSLRSGIGTYRWLNNAPIAKAPQWLIALVTQSTPGEGRNAFAAFAEDNKSPTQKLNALALAKLPAWVLQIFPTAKRTNDGGYRISSADLGRDLQEDLSIHPTGIKDWGVHDIGDPRRGGRTPIDIVMEWGEMDFATAVDWLSKQVGYEPEAKSKEQDKPTESKPTDAVVLVRAADVKVRPKEWLWEGHLLRGGLELLTGLPGLGKSQVQIHLMACATAGLPWPDGASAIEPVNVIMVTAEDALDTEVVPRLMAAKADLDRIHILKCIKTDKAQRQFLLAEDLVKLQWTITQVGNVGLVCIDPITAYMGGKTDSHKATEVRSQLGPLKDFSEHSNIALSAITHPAKNAGSKAIDHFIGSQAFVAAARVGHACFEEIEEDEDGENYPTGRILFTNVKHNAHRKMPTLAFRIESHFIYPEPFLPIESSYVVWEKEAVDISADQAVAAARGKAKREEASSEIVEFLRMMLDAGGGSCKQTDVAEQAKALGYSDKELRTARKKAHIVSKKEGFDGPWMWTWEGGKQPD
jgi:AAA domain/Bifunctional DNA primase/polymerase, N-terminal